ncbi:hypothetical protein DFS34DRAFT_646574 [Phlyctochytrium arcticum]|nr:hypothetical protein DFS34DRAFT_646574 [Phlyctochytrium arcticum]
MPVFTSDVPNVEIPIIDSYSFIFDGAANFPRRDQTAMIDAATGMRVSYGELVHRINRFASGLKFKVKLDRWDVVGIFSPNHIDYPTVVYGALRAECAVTLANPAYTVDELAYQLNDAGAEILVTFAPLLETALAAAAKAGIGRERVFIIDQKATNGIKSITDVFSCEYLPAAKFTRDELMNKPAYLCYSSGTTGRSKGVETTHYNMVANALQIHSFHQHYNPHSPIDVWTGVLPFYHIYGLNCSLHVCFLAGLPLVVFQKFDLVKYLEAMEKYKVTFTHVAPPIIVALAKHPIVEKFNLTYLRGIMSGAAPLGADISLDVMKRLKCEVFQGYGMTETSPVTHISARPRTPLGSVGLLLPNVQARIVNPDTGKECNVNENGELWVRGPMVMKGYHNNEAATRDTIDADGYLHTGDIGYVDSEGNFYLVDRLKELIKYKGFQVPPAELEGYLLTHPSIADAAVISRPDEAAGELPRAFIVLKPNAPPVTEKEVMKFIEERVAQHKRLRGGVAVLSEIPKSASGKILRRILRDMDKEVMQQEARIGKSKL